MAHKTNKYDLDVVVMITKPFPKVTFNHVTLLYMFLFILELSFLQGVVETANL